MHIFRNTHALRRILTAPITIIALTVILVLIIKGVVGAYESERKSSEELKKARQNAEELASRERFLENQIERLESPRGLEEELRGKFPVAKEGEHVVIIVDQKDSAGATASEEPASLWTRFLDLFR